MIPVGRKTGGIVGHGFGSKVRTYYQTNLQKNRGLNGREKPRGGDIETERLEKNRKREVFLGDTWGITRTLL